MVAKSYNRPNAPRPLAQGVLGKQQLSPRTSFQVPAGGLPPVEAKNHFAISPGLRFGQFKMERLLLRFLTQLDSILGATLGLCWRLLRDFEPLESRYYLEVVSASIFLRFRTPLED